MINNELEAFSAVFLAHPIVPVFRNLNTHRLRVRILPEA